MFDQELESFKNDIDLRAYAASQGYAIDARESWRGSAVMRHATSDKIIIKRDADGHYVYFSVRDDADHGTIIDFVRRRLGVSLGSVRKELRPWIAMPPSAIPPYPPLPKVAKDRLRVYREFARMLDAPRHPYLENERGIPAELLTSERFLGRIKIDARGNAVFPHFDADGLSGYELKNRDFTGFASGGVKALWVSNTRNDDDCMVFCESAIDALSHAVLFPDDHTRYASIGGKPNPVQPELIRAAAARMRAGSEITAAMGADADGRKLAEVVKRAVEMSGRCDLHFHVHEPSGFKDWNDQLRAKPRALPGRAYDRLTVVAMLIENTTFEKHFRVGDLAQMWSLGRETVRKLVKDDPGVIRIRMGRKKAHTVYSIPESAARRIHTRLLNSV